MRRLESALSAIVLREGMVYHVELGTYIFGGRVDRRGAGLWWAGRYGQLHCPSAVFRVSGALLDQPGRAAVSTASGLGFSICNSNRIDPSDRQTRNGPVRISYRAVSLRFEGFTYRSTITLQPGQRVAGELLLPSPF